MGNKSKNYRRVSKKWSWIHRRKLRKQEQFHDADEDEESHSITRSEEDDKNNSIVSIHKDTAEMLDQKKQKFHKLNNSIYGNSNVNFNKFMLFSSDTAQFKNKNTKTEITFGSEDPNKTFVLTKDNLDKTSINSVAVKIPHEGQNNCLDNYINLKCMPNKTSLQVVTKSKKLNDKNLLSLQKSCKYSNKSSDDVNEFKPFINENNKFPPVKTYSKYCKNSVKKTYNLTDHSFKNVNTFQSRKISFLNSTETLKNIDNTLISNDGTNNENDQTNHFDVKINYNLESDCCDKNSTNFPQVQSSYKPSRIHCKNPDKITESNVSKDSLLNHDQVSSKSTESDSIVKNIRILTANSLNSRNVSENDKNSIPDKSSEIKNIHQASVTENKKSDVNHNVSPSETEKKSIKEVKIDGRRIVDITWMSDQLHEAFDYGHEGSCKGLFRDMRIIKASDHGLLTLMVWQCQKCSKTSTIWTNPKNSTHQMNLNESAVLGTLITGTGYSSLREQFASMNIPCMADETYRKNRDKMEDIINGTSEEAMLEAAEMERELALQNGDYIIDENGEMIPFITVIVDGAWSKRAYKGGRYDALSGFAVIIGLRTGRVLFSAVRNKYCSIYARASKLGKEPRFHKCYKNYGRNEPSTAMEASIIVEGFNCSVEMHGLIYACFVGDGDSNVHKTILDNNPYKDYDIMVSKKECKNHLFRNFCHHIDNASKMKIPPNTVKGIVKLREYVKASGLKMKKFVDDILDGSKKNVDRSDQIKKIRDAILDMPKHFFGDHTKCTTDKKEQCDKIFPNLIPILEKVGIYPVIMQIVTRLSKHADSLIDNLTTNKVEGLNSIENKTLGGRRVNYSMRNSFNLRVSLAVTQNDTQQVLSSLYQYQGLQVPSTITKMESSKQAQVLRTSKSRNNRGRTSRRYFGADANYGNVQDDDKSATEYQQAVDAHFEKLKKRQKNRDAIMKETIEQAECGNWHKYRRDMITASHFGLICRKKPQTSCAGIVKQILYSRSLGNVDSVNYGKDNEKQALKDLAVKLGINHDRIKPCGLFIDQHIEYLGATPDGIIDDDYIVEIKCLASIRHLSPDEALKIDNKNIKTIFNKNKTSLNKNHHYYYQVQGQLHITNKKYCYFTIWTPYGVKYNLVEKDDDFWKTSMENYLTQFYTECVLPEIIDSRFTRNMPIREPTFILEAQKKAANLKKEKEDKENEKRKKKKNTDKEISTKKITIISNESIKIDLSNLLRKKRKNENSIDNHLYNLPKKQMKTADCSKVITDKVTIQRSNDDCKRKVAINSWITIPNSDKIFTDEEILKAIEIIDNLRVNISLSNVISNISSSDSLLNDESIEYFLQILDQNSDNYTHPVLYYSYPHLIVPSKTKRDLQIIGGNQNRHWRCIRFDGTNLFVYDSLSLPLSTEDYDYIRKRFPQVKPNNITFIEVTHQSDTYSCGVYAAAFATTIALGDDPCLYQYSQNSQAMRMHMIKIIEQRKLMLFPTE